MAQTITVTEVLEKIKLMAKEEFSSCECSVFSDDTISIEVKPTYSVRVTLEIELIPADTRQGYETKITINWSSTPRSLASAQANVRLYAKTCDFAALIECFINDLPSIVKE